MADDHIQDVEKEGGGLKDLLETSYPLLKTFRELCPGTYKHSQAVASMIEGISIDLDLDVTFMKVCSFYHDIGKINNPKYFSENQIEENPHDKLEPSISYQIISRHVSDTALILLNDDKFPRKLIQIVSQHHGTSVIKYFFTKSGSDIEDYYRYKCQKPTCVESAILMICDCVEARSRSELHSGKFDPKFIIDDTIDSLLTDCQLDEVYMKLGDLQKIKTSLAKELEGTYQKRIDYSKAKDEVK